MMDDEDDNDEWTFLGKMSTSNIFSTQTVSGGRFPKNANILPKNFRI